MTGVSTIFTLIANTVKKELAAEGAHDDLVELATEEFVAIHLVDFVLALANGTLTSKTSIQGAFAQILLDCEVDLTGCIH